VAYSNRGALFITWDESYATDTRIGMILLSPLGCGCGYASTNYYTHSSMLRTVQELLDVGPFLGDATNATNLGELFFPTNKSPAFEVCRVASLGSNVVQLTVHGVTAGAPLVLQCSSNLGSWSTVCTNASPTRTCLFNVTNAAGTGDRAFYRFAQRLP